MDTHKLLCDLLIYVPISFLALYFSGYFALNWSFYRVLEKNRDTIRHAIAEKWVQEHKNFISIIDKVHVKYIRVLVKTSKTEDRGFRALQVAFIVLSVLLFLGGIVTNRLEPSEEIERALLGCIAFYCIAFTIVLFKSYYEFRFYQLLDELEDISNMSSKPKQEKPSLHASEASLPP